MAWNCSCKQANHDDAPTCGNCGKKRPKYLGVKINFGAKKLNALEIANWYLLIAYDYLVLAKAENEGLVSFIREFAYPPYKESFVLDKYNNRKKRIDGYCSDGLKFVEEAEKEGHTPQITDGNGATLDANTIRSELYFEQGQKEFSTRLFDQAIINFEKSFNADRNQRSIYHIALATIELPVEGGGLFSAKKTEEAKANKKKQEIDLLTKTIQFSPMTHMGVKAAGLLYSRYQILISETDFAKVDDQY